MLTHSPCGGAVAGPASLLNQRPFKNGFGFLGLGRHQHQRGRGGHARFVIRAVFPQAHQQHRQLAGHGHHRASLFAGADAGEMLAVGAQRTDRAERPEDIMRGAHQQSSQQAVAAFADAQLFVRAAALVAARAQAQIWPHVAAAAEARRLADLQHEAQRGERAHAGDLLEALGDGISIFAARDQVAFQGFDLFGKVAQDGEHRLDHRQTVGGHRRQNAFVKCLRRRIADRAQGS